MRVVYDGIDTFEDGSHRLKVFDQGGLLLVEYPCRNDSVSPIAWRADAGCPPGTYTLGYPEGNVTTLPSTPDNDWMGEGLWFVPVNNVPGHTGIGIHGGGSASPDPLADRQGWYPTENCFRLQNTDLTHFVATLKTSGSWPIVFEVAQSEKD